jgi:hypothetical protein
MDAFIGFGMGGASGGRKGHRDGAEVLGTVSEAEQGHSDFLRFND